MTDRRPRTTSPRRAGEDGAPVELGDTTTDVVRRQPDGTWLIAVDDPFGLA